MMSPLDPMVTCPYEPSHRIIKSRLPFHLLKCSKQHRQIVKQRCIYDATHLIEPLEYEDHIANCPSRGIWDSFVHMESDKVYDTELVDETAEESSTLCTEDWNGGKHFYKPLDAARGKNVLIQSMCLSKKERKDYKIAERNRIAKIEKHEVPKLSVLLAHLKPLRAPKTASKALTDTKSNENESDDQNEFIDKLISQFENVSTKDNDASSSETKTSIKREESKENIPEGTDEK